ncbi:hypothetical protein M8818_004337 [Zalaria obscura]|uniref:Uncharacterized protein n=1 Tax=Zalaria obscura TaxID=2024903 RepID=A0ACC3SBR6_9PEZI
MASIQHSHVAGTAGDSYEVPAAKSNILHATHAAFPLFGSQSRQAYHGRHASGSSQLTAIPAFSHEVLISPSSFYASKNPGVLSRLPFRSKSNTVPAA